MPHTISKEQLVAFYDAHWDEMKDYILGHYITGWNAHGAAHRKDEDRKWSPIRNGDNGKPIEVHSKQEFLNLVRQKYLTEIVPEIPLITHQDETDELVVDMDSPFLMEANKPYVIDCWLFAEQNIPKDLHPHITAEFTGGKSFHIRIKINPFLKWEDAKELLERDIIKPFYEKYGSGLTFPPSARSPSRVEKRLKIHLDLSSMKARGTLRCPDSFYDDTNRFEKLFHSLDELKRFKIEDATFSEAIPIKTQMANMLKAMGSRITDEDRILAMTYFITVGENPINKSGKTLTAAFKRWASSKMVVPIEFPSKPSPSIPEPIVPTPQRRSVSLKESRARHQL